MKLSVSAYRAHASAHKKILDTAYQLNYGSTSASHHGTSGGTTCTGFQLDPPSSESTPGGSSSTTQGAPAGGGVSGGASSGPGGAPGATGCDDAGGASSDDARTPLHSPRSPNTSREDEEEESSNANESDCKSPSQRVLDTRSHPPPCTNCSMHCSHAAAQRQAPIGSHNCVPSGASGCFGTQRQPLRRHSIAHTVSSSFAASRQCHNSFADDDNDAESVDGDDDESDDDEARLRAGYEEVDGENVLAPGDGEAAPKMALQSWRNLRAVMAYYQSLRKIKRTKSNQRWMKLRTTVQISSAIQKKPPLKREDSFLQRFATRHQIPEAQETVEDTGSEGGGGPGGGPGGHSQGGGHGGPRRRRQRRQRQPKSVVNPDENFYFHWLLVLTVSVLYNMWTLIVRQSFPELQQMLSTFWLICDTSSDIFFLADVVVQLRTGYLEQGLMVYDSRKLAKHYLASRAFLLDLAALCPLDLLQIRLGTQPLLRFPRFLKVYRAVNYYYMVESRTVYPNLWRVVNLIHILLILAHWFGCFYFLLSQAEGFQGDWVYPYRPGDYATLTRKYLGSLYWSTLTLTTIGDLPTPETNVEITNSVDGPRSLPRRGVKSRLLQFNTNGGYVFTIVSYLIGVFIFATIVGQVGNVITNRNANRLEFERLLDGAKTYMRHHKVPGGMKRRVLRWYDYSWSRGRIQGGGDINTALGLLPDKLKTELALHVNLTVLKKVTIFQECQPEFLRDLVLKMKAYIFTPGDSICRKGEVAREMFIIADGILEVISEAGKVLTTMKAGDFFGEIGILNLDGLNKRTADVRSVGYSELFSLSREDVLNAMKDYPEAQEILQALGRKRLMEVKASARQHAKEMKEHDNKGLVDKIKNEAKGLRNALRKTRTHHRRSHESLEMQPLHPGVTNLSVSNKGMLRRMPRVRSHELSQEDQQTIIGTTTEIAEEKVVSPLGAGLPLLSRLRLLKEKQENEERLSNCTALHSPSPAASVKSPPPVPEEPEESDSPPSALASSTATTIVAPIAPSIAQQSQQSEIIGAGLPLLQRLLLLKAKEDRLSVSQPTSPNTASGIVAISSTSSTPPPSTRLSFSIPTARSSVSSTTSRSSLSVPGATPAPPSSRSSGSTATASGKLTAFRDRIGSKLMPNRGGGGGGGGDSTHLLHPQQHCKPEIVTTSANVSSANSKTTKSTNSSKDQHHNDSSGATTMPPLQTSVSSDEAPWIRLKKAAIGDKEPVMAPTVPHPPTTTAARSQQPPARPTLTKKPSLVLTSRHKQYRSIDDLSPEYGGLPFVKKLKILNERQKLEELETVMKTRSFSLDMPESQVALDLDSLTRSQSEGCAMHQQRAVPQDRNLLSAQLSVSPLHSSTESNETLERRQLRSILKKLSEETTPASTISATIDGAEFRRLMRAPTIEGYAARHSKLAKSVTFNRDTLPSPPSSGGRNLAAPAQHNAVSVSANEQQQHVQTIGSHFPFPAIASPLSNLSGNGDSNQLVASLNTTNNNNSTTTSTTNTNGALKLASPTFGPLQMGDDEQQYFADIVLAVRQVMSAHLHDIHDKYGARCAELELRLRDRNRTITELRAHIAELVQERNGVSTTSGCGYSGGGFGDSFTDSMETVVSGVGGGLRGMVIGGGDTLDDADGDEFNHSWDSPSHYETHELDELRHESLTPHTLWRPGSATSAMSAMSAPATITSNVNVTTTSTTLISRQLERSAVDSCVLDMDSNTDTDVSVSDEERPRLQPYRSPVDRAGGESSTGDDEFENSPNNWEMEMLAAQMRASRRSTSLDPHLIRSASGGAGNGSSAGRAVRRRFVRGSSCRD